MSKHKSLDSSVVVMNMTEKKYDDADVDGGDDDDQIKLKKL